MTYRRHLDDILVCLDQKYIEMVKIVMENRQFGKCTHKQTIQGKVSLVSVIETVTDKKLPQK